MNDPTREEFIRQLQYDDAFYTWTRGRLNLAAYAPPNEVMSHTAAEDATDPLDQSIDLLLGTRRSKAWAEIKDELTRRGIRTVRDFVQLSRAELLSFKALLWYLEQMEKRAKDLGYQLVATPPWEQTGSEIGPLGQKSQGVNPWAKIAKWGITHLGQLNHVHIARFMEIDGIGIKGFEIVYAKMAKENFRFIADEQE